MTLKEARTVEGQRSGRYEVIDPGPIYVGKLRHVLIRCDCGFENEVREYDFISGNAKQCRSCVTKKMHEKRRLPDNQSAWNDLYNDYVQSAKSRNLDFKLSTAEFFAIVKLPCFYCGSAPSSQKKCRSSVAVYNGIDRLDNSKGYVHRNVAACCRICNQWKKAMDMDDFIAHAAKITSYRESLNW